MSRVLVTSFEPFTTGKGLTLTHNPTSDITDWINTNRKDIATAVLPVAFEATKAHILELFEERQPELWLGLGYAPHREKIDVEMVGLNIERAVRPDNDGDCPSYRHIIEGAPLAYNAPYDAPELVQHLCDNKFDAQQSFHAGTFMCNQVLFLGSHQVQNNTSLQKAGFIHIPPGISADTFGAALVAWIDTQ